MTNKMLKFIAPLAVFLIFMITSCQKEELTDLNSQSISIELEELINKYPAKVTLDNWKEFIDAPLEVINYHTAKENASMQETTSSYTPIALTSVAGVRSNNVSGQVIKFDLAVNDWIPIAGVDISINNCAGTSTISNGSIGNNYNLNIPDNCIGSGFSLCMDYDTPALNGVNNDDIIAIEQHILGVTPFTTARQYLAADVNRTGTITALDLVGIQAVILGIVPNFPGNTNMLFTRFSDYQGLQGLIDLGTGDIDPLVLQWIGILSNCLNPTLTDRHAIKTGDVTGDFQTTPITCNVINQGCNNVVLTYCSDGRLTATFTGVVHSIKIWKNGWQSSEWFCSGNDIYPSWNNPCLNGLPPLQLNPNSTYSIELNGGQNLPDFQYPAGTQLCIDPSMNIPLQ